MISATRLLTTVTAVPMLAICLAGSVQAASFRLDLTANSVQDGKIDASIGRKGGSLNPLVNLCRRQRFRGDDPADGLAGVALSTTYNQSLGLKGGGSIQLDHRSRRLAITSSGPPWAWWVQNPTSDLNKT
jgi:hypothetical protein